MEVLITDQRLPITGSRGADQTLAIHASGHFLC